MIHNHEIISDILRRIMQEDEEKDENKVFIENEIQELFFSSFVVRVLELFLIF